MTIAGVVNHAGTLNIQNGPEETSEANIARNAAMAAMEISGTLNNAGTTNITNRAAGGLNVTETGKINSNGLTMLNTGAGGFTLDGVGTNVGEANLTNRAGAMNIGGTFTNTGNATILNDGTVLNVSGNITNNTGDLSMVNNGDGGFNITATGKVDADGVEMLNTGAGGFHTTGTITNVGNAELTNKAGAMNIGGTFTNTGDATILNDGTGLNVTGNVTNNNGIKLNFNISNNASNTKATIEGTLGEKADGLITFETKNFEKIANIIWGDNTVSSTYNENLYFQTGTCGLFLP